MRAEGEQFLVDVLVAAVDVIEAADLGGAAKAMRPYLESLR